MRKSVSIFLVFMICLLLGISTAAEAGDVEITKIQRTTYGYMDGYGFYDKCADYSEFWMILKNNSNRSYTIRFPDNGRIGNENNGSEHQLANLQYKNIDYGSIEYARSDRQKFSFNGETEIPAQSSYAFFFTVKDFTPFNLYWDTDLFFTIQVKDVGNVVDNIKVKGRLFRHGDACGPDKIISAEITSGHYNAAGNGEITALVKNNMPDATEVTPNTTVSVTYTDKNGKKQTKDIDNAVTWNKSKFWIGSGSKETLTGKLNLSSIDLSDVTDLSLKAKFTRPSSTPNYPGFTAEKTLEKDTSLRGTFSGSFEADGSKGTFTAEIFNNLTDPVTFSFTASKDAQTEYEAHAAVTATLPSTGKVLDADGNSSEVSLNWLTGNGETINAGESKVFNGEFTFKDTSLIHSSKTLTLTADFITSAASGGSTGTITRNSDPNATIIVNNFCRDLKRNNWMMSFTYRLTNPSLIDIDVELATTLAIPGQLPNPEIQYTACYNGYGVDCMSRIHNGIISIAAGETIAFNGQAALYTQVNPNITGQTSLRYFLDGKPFALYVGKTATSCASPVIPAASPSQQTPAATPYPVGNDLATVSLCRTIKDGKNVEFQYTLKNKSNTDLRLELAKTLAIQGETGYVPISNYTGCRNLNGSACTLSGQPGEIFILKAGETVQFNAQSTLPKTPAVEDYTIRTSLIYYTGPTNTSPKAFFIGRWKNTCGTTPAPVTGDLKSEGFCRTLRADNSKLDFSYTLKNQSTKEAKVQLATTLFVTDQTRYLQTTYIACTNGSTSCLNRINNYMISMPAGETITVSGSVTPDKPISISNFIAYTSLVYWVDDVRYVLDIGSTTAACAAPKDAESLMDVSEGYAVAPILDAYITGAYVSSCDNRIHFTLNISNSGLADGIVDLNAISLIADGKDMPAAVVSCVENAVSGTRTAACTSDMADGTLTINPNVSMKLDLVSEPVNSSNTRTLIALIPDVSSDGFEFTADPAGEVCGHAADIYADNGEEIIQTAVSAAKDMLNLTIRLANDADTDSAIMPGTIYFTRDALDAYSGTVTTVSIDDPAVRAVSEFIRGQQITVPARSYAEFSVDVKMNLTEAFDSTAKFSWNFNTNGEPVNYTGSVDFAQKSLDIEDAAALIGKSFVPERTGERNTLHFYSLGAPRIPETLPATGLSGNEIFVGLSRPADLKYQELNGLHLEIPVIDAQMDLVRVPLDEKNEWAVEWLGDKAGVLSSSALPGRGTSLIAAHNHLDKVNAGPFNMLQSLNMKDRIFVTDGKGKMLSYSVYANELVAPNDGELLYQKAIPGSLVLVTCEDELPEGGYAFRRVVYAEPLQ